MEKSTKAETKMKNNFLLISLEDSKSKKLAEVISNDSCRKILEFLAKKDATETEMSKELKIPISTVHYNLKALQEAKLVTVEEFHYSQKGKEVNHYSLANKYIIIAPKSGDSSFMESLKKILPLTLITAVVAGILGFFSLITQRSGFAAMKSSALEYSVSGVDQVANDALRTAGSAAAPTASAAPAVSTATQCIRPAMQSNLGAYVLVGVLSVILIYFLYTWIKKK